MRVMAIDYGDAHTGVAVSDLTGLLAGYTDTIHSRRREEVVRRLGEIIGEYTVEELVLGYPKNMDGTLGPRAEKAAALAQSWRRPSACRCACGTSGAPPSTPTTSWPPRARTPESGRRRWTPWRRP